MSRLVKTETCVCVRKGSRKVPFYDDLRRITSQRHDPCLSDTFIVAVRFMEVELTKPWWEYTAKRKSELAARKADGR